MRSVEGVIDVRVSTERKSAEALLLLPSCTPATNEALERAVDKAGYRASVSSLKKG